MQLELRGFAGFGEVLPADAEQAEKAGKCGYNGPGHHAEHKGDWDCGVG